MTPPPLTYMVEVHTGDVKGAGTGANVFVTLEGSGGSSSKQLLQPGEGVGLGRGGGFERGSVTKAEVRVQPNLGRVKRLVIGHDNSGFGSDWFLDHVVLYEKSDPDNKLFFECGQWLSRTQGDGLIERVLDSAPSLSPRVPSHAYLVEVVTGAVRGAGTDANVFVTLFGERGSSGERRLDNHPDNFERGR